MNTRSRSKPYLTRRGFLQGSSALAGVALFTACARERPEAPNPSSSPTAVTATVENPTVENPTVENPTRVSAQVATNAGRPANAGSFAQESIRLVNAARQTAGLEPLAETPILSQVAQNYSTRMANEGFYGHVDPQGKDVTDRIAATGYLALASAENIASGQPDPATVVEGWLNSPGHRANIMNPELTEIGAGYAYTTTGDYHHFWTHVFATPDPSMRRDRNLYPVEALEQINQLRQQSGLAPLVRDATLESLAMNHLRPLVESDSYESRAEQMLQEVSQAALASFQQVVAITAAGASTPEKVVTEWGEAQNRGGNPLADPAYRLAGVAYLFVEENKYRHYWLLLLAA